jgi:hypothetical protein
MRAIDAVNESVWAIASHAGGRQITGCGYKNRLGFTVAIPHVELFSEFCEQDLLEALQSLGIDDEHWTPEGSEELYEVITITEEVQA